MVDMKNWTDKKLAKELAFAKLAKDSSDPFNMAWLKACEAESTRRKES